MDYFGLERHLWAWIVAAVFTFFTFVLYVVHVRLHLLHNHHPQLRRQTLRILTLPPLYAIESWLGLYMKDYSLIWDSLRECYEAYVIYSFLHFLMDFLGGHDALIKILSKKTMIRKKKAEQEAEEKNAKNASADTESAKNDADDKKRLSLHADNSDSPSSSSSLSSSNSTNYRKLAVPVAMHPIPVAQDAEDAKARPTLESQATIADIDLYAIPISIRSQPHLRPFNWFMRPWTLPYEFLFRCRVGILQYVFVKIALAIVTIITDFTDVYHANEWRLDGTYVWVLFISNSSQIAAMYCLVLFYYAVADELKEIRPVPKFLCVKAVVFFSFWQSVLISFLVFLGTINATQTYSADDVSTGIQDFCICIEMFIAAIVHFYAFPAREFESEKIMMSLPETALADAHKPMKRLLQAVSPMDMLTDMKELRAMEKNRKQRKKEIEAAQKKQQDDAQLRAQSPDDTVMTVIASGKKKDSLVHHVASKSSSQQKTAIGTLQSPSDKSGIAPVLTPSLLAGHAAADADSQVDVTVAFVPLSDGNGQADAVVVVAS